MTKIYLVEDHHIVRYGIKNLLELNAEYQIVGEAESAEDLLADLNKTQVDIVITDISMEGMDGIELTKKIKKLSGGSIRVLVLSMHADQLYINNCFEAGANGYLLKDFKKNELYSAIDKIMKGEKFISRSVSQILADSYINKEFNGSARNNQKVDITKREKEIIELISQGLSNKEIAEKLFVSISTVDAHRYNILKKLDVKNTAEMITKAIKNKIIIPK
ncbi:MAG: Response regulator containing a CheY-like receiver domain and an DNA-binding domain [Bacteroidetes bacterium]|jgi:DNA-binding NarL/FixJ family response regulator|nr:Response regulator containing a CheY-like receiver domain and an DNA-binding domain [Bacteroidota bacterium]